MATTVEKKIARNVLNIMSKAISTAMASIDAHEGRYMQLNLREALESPGFHKTVKKRKYVHTAEYLARKAGKRIYRKKDESYWGL